ncbi:MAG: MoaD family protein [Deltaproteobacteria bacterium]|nr:MoaD family protein [Deltaproteobacteria bacterium]
MIKVKVNSFFTMKEIIGNGSEVKLKKEDSTVDGLLKELSNLHGEKFKKQILDEKTGKVKFYRIVLNGRQCTNTTSALHDGDIIEFYPALAGG